MSKPTAIITDLDGTLANCDHRLHHLKKDKPDWSAFYEGMEHDQVNRWCRDILNAFEHVNAYRFGATFNDAEETKILIVTGRPESYRNKVMGWLEDTASVLEDDIFMREDGNHEPDWQLKKRVYLERIKPHYDVLFVLEDRQQVVDMYREQGLTVLQCADGKY